MSRANELLRKDGSAEINGLQDTLPAKSAVSGANETTLADRYGAGVDPAGWRPIASAPEDGTEILGCYFRDWGDGSNPTVYGPWTVAFSKRSKKWESSWGGMRVIEAQGDFGTDYHVPDVQPNLWMPLPTLGGSDE